MISARLSNFSFLKTKFCNHASKHLFITAHRYQTILYHIHRNTHTKCNSNYVYCTSLSLKNAKAKIHIQTIGPIFQCVLISSVLCFVYVAKRKLQGEKRKMRPSMQYLRHGPKPLRPAAPPHHFLFRTLPKALVLELNLAKRMDSCVSARRECSVITTIAHEFHLLKVSLWALAGEPYNNFIFCAGCRERPATVVGY
jgi:hypothetical protein